MKTGDPGKDPGIDRRGFLKRAGAEAGVIVAGASALGATSPRRPSPLTRRLGSARQAPDVAIVGAGAFGVWTALHLRQLGAEVVLIDAWGPGNSRATSGDETRGVRSSYGDRPAPNDILWCQWARESIARWIAWDEEWGQELKLRLFFPTGDIILRPDWQPFPTRTREIWEQIGTPHEVLTADEVRYRWPVMDVSGMSIALYEPEAGVVRARRTCEAVAEVFRQLGGETVIARAELGSREGGSLNGLRLSTGETLSAGVFVVATGPWLAKTVPEAMGDRLRTPLGYVFYYGTPPGDDRFTYPNLPSWNVPGVTGWPALGRDNRGFRVRTGGNGDPEHSDPDLSERYIPLDALERPRKILTERFPALRDAPLLQTHACHYESSISRNFVIDVHPNLENVWVTGAGSAEAFKFGPVLGEYIANRLLGQDIAPELADRFRIPEDKYEDPRS